MARTPVLAPLALLGESPSDWSILIRIVVGALLVIHGVAHVDITRVWGSRDSASSWLLGVADRPGDVLAIVALIAFVLAGLALVAGLGIWSSFAVVAASVSLVTIALFWHPRMALGVVIDLGLLVAVLWAGWLPRSFSAIRG